MMVRIGRKQLKGARFLFEVMICPKIDYGDRCTNL